MDRDNYKNNKGQTKGMALETVRGMRDFLPEVKIDRDSIISIIRETFEKYGFVPLETPVLENAELLKGKYGDEEKLIYEFKDKGGRRLAMRYDLTVPLARVVSTKNFSWPLKRYAIDRVWRYDRPQKGRYREFYQCDVDIIGVKGFMADAEIIACINEALTRVGLREFTFRINSRELMNMLMIDVGVSNKNISRALRIIDKLDKIGKKGVEKELNSFLSKQTVNELMTFINLKGSWESISKNLLIDNPIRSEMQSFLNTLKKFGVKNYIIDFSLARGLSYYTGIIFEVDAGPKIGSLGGGGRYDEMIYQLSGKEVPATGGSIGIERVIDLLGIQGKKSLTDVFVVPIGTATPICITLVQRLRKNGVKAEVDLMDRSLSKNLDYISKQGIPYALIVGQSEIGAKKYKLKNMKTGKEQLMTFDALLKKLR